MYVNPIIIIIVAALVLSGCLGTIAFAVLHAHERAKAKRAENRSDSLGAALADSREANADLDESVRTANARAASEARRASVAMGRLRRLADAVQAAADKRWSQPAVVELVAVQQEMRTPRNVVEIGGAR